MKTLALTIALSLVAATTAWTQEPGAPGAPGPIEDNSFLLEEAYNQETGIVQHINTLLRVRPSWVYGFTQEWPVYGQRHQLSYTVALQPGVDELAVNYRLQVAGVGGGNVALAPRVSLLMPLADAGSAGVQFNFPASVTVAPQLVTHWNAGATFVPRLPAVYNAGASAIFLLRPTVNLMVEFVWEGTGRPGEGEFIVNPGIRWAHNLGALQIVPGVAWPDGREVFFYLSLEHPFK